MSLAINKLISSLIQIVLFSLIPFVYWYFKGRKNHKFTEWIGLKRVKRIDKTLILSIFIVTIIYLIIGIFLLKSLSVVNNATSEFAGLRFKAILAIIIYAAFNTALPEEILFRGFVLKRLVSKIGFNNGNIIQSILFGLIHGIMFFPIVGVLKSLLIIFATGSIAFAMGYINEKLSDGSILPSFIIHSVSNLVAGLYVAFFL